MIDSRQLLEIQVNKLIDTLLSDWNMVFMQRYFDGLKPAVKDKEDAVLGFMYGMVCAAVADYLGQDQQKISNEDVNIVRGVFQNRLSDIKDKVCKNLNIAHSV
jgi:hypothetical protein